MPRQRAGFTLIELMIVITIMGTMAAMIAPGIGEFLADARAAGAAEAVVRISRHMQARTQQTGLAHLLEFSSQRTVAGGLGRLRIYEGMNNHCRQTPWLDAINGSVENGHAPIDVLDMSSGEYNPSAGSPSMDDRDRQVITLNVLGSAIPELAVICIEPGGTVWEGAASSVEGSGFVFAKPPSTKAIKFVVARKVNGATRGSDRTVLFSTSGIARFKF